MAQNAINTTSDQLPNGYPVKQNTGNSDMDNLNYENAKKEWIKNNPDEYRTMIGTSNENSQTTISTVNPDAGKPIFVSKADFDASPLTKQQYITEHPELYTIGTLEDQKKDDLQLLELNSKLNNKVTTNMIFITKTDLNKASTDKQQFILAHPELYTITE